MMLKDFLGYISEKKIGFMPLDILAHFFIGILIFIILKKKINTKFSFLILVILTLSKEAYDLNVMTNTYIENLKDIVVSLLGPLVIHFYSVYSRTNHNEEHPQQ